MLAIRDRQGVVRPLTTAGLIGLISAAALVGGFANNALAWIGRRELSPDYRMSALETADAQLTQRIDLLTDQIEDVRDLTTMLVAMKCVDRDSLLALQAQVPCATVLRERGMKP